MEANERPNLTIVDDDFEAIEEAGGLSPELLTGAAIGVGIAAVGGILYAKVLKPIATPLIEKAKEKRAAKKAAKQSKTAKEPEVVVLN